MRYTCANCDHSFDTQDDKPRCPQCLRRHGLLAEDGKSKASKDKKSKGTGGEEGASGADSVRDVLRDRERRRLIISAVVAVVLVGGGVAAYFGLRSKPVDEGPKNVALGPVSAKTLRAVARRRGTPVATIYFQADKAIIAAGRRYGRNSDGSKVAAALLKEVRRTLGPKGLRIRRPGRTKHGGLHSASQIFAAIASKDVITVYSYELASLYLALARAAGLHAVMAELYRHSDRKGPADPLGHVGHFGVAIYAKAKFVGRPVMVVDPARGTLNAAKEYEVLTDLRALAHGLALEALQLAEKQSEAARAIEGMEAALRLAPQSATLQAAKGMLLLKSGGVDPALNAFLAARSIREDAPRYLLVAMAYTQKDAAKGVMNRALSNMDQAISRDPSYALAYVMKADLLLRKGKVDLASAQLDRAQEIDANLVEALQARGLIMLASGKKGPGVALLRKAVKMDPLDDQARFQLWRVLLQLDQADEAKTAAKDWLAMLPSANRPQARQLMERFLKMFKQYKAKAPPVAPGAGPGARPGEDPYKLKMPGQTSPGPGAGASPGAPGGTSPFPNQDKKLQL
jgi:tetratricopeptide (TPR) repeat protein